MTLQDLKSLLAAGDFHHATQRHDIAPGLHIYRKGGPYAFRGYSHVGYFSDSDKDLIRAAHELVRKTGVYEGTYR
jgi:hypothetical protein